MKLFVLIVGLEAAPGYGTYNILMEVSDSSERELYSVKSTLYLGSWWVQLVIFEKGEIDSWRSVFHESVASFEGQLFLLQYQKSLVKLVLTFKKSSWKYNRLTDNLIFR